MQLHIKKLHPDAKLPTYALPGDAGMDFYTTEEVTILPGQIVIIHTGIALAIPLGYAGLLWDKSGLANKYGLKIVGGVFDAGYRGEILPGMLNTSAVPYTFAKGDKVTQMLIQKVEQPQLIEVDELDETARGAGKHGSTGK
ncbi:MAG: Deoxyuridine 5-triphosphate nucleotidohydrolase [Candidatus Parcubacteria bacterium]|jgi:dUTP pyrophosphatase